MKNNPTHLMVSIVHDLVAFSKDKNQVESFNPKPPILNTKWNFVSAEKESVFKKLYRQEQTLGDITRKIFVGLQTSADKIYLLKILKENENTYTTYSKALEEEIEIEKGLIKLFLLGKDVKRYEPLAPKYVVIFPYSIIEGKSILMDQKFIKKTFPLGWSYLLKNKKELENREKGKMKGDNFYAYIYPKNLSEFEVQKICTPDIANSPEFTFDISSKLYHTTTVYSFVFIHTIQENQKYFLGILNSKLFWYFVKNTGNVLRGNFFRFKTEYLKPFPIKLINFHNTNEEIVYKEIISLVDQLLQLHQEKSTIKLQSSLAQIQGKIDYCERRVDELVYELYGLTEEERKVVEGA
ncbi:MAG: TaqI-like C-terminal specificity domain-containing protein [Saprospiraceae bacterium]